MITQEQWARIMREARELSIETGERVTTLAYWTADTDTVSFESLPDSMKTQNPISFKDAFPEFYRARAWDRGTAAHR